MCTAWVMLKPHLSSLSGLRKMKMEASTCSLKWPTIAITTTPASNLQAGAHTHRVSNQFNLVTQISYFTISANLTPNSSSLTHTFHALVKKLCGPKASILTVSSTEYTTEQSKQHANIVDAYIRIYIYTYIRMQYVSTMHVYIHTLTDSEENGYA